MNEATQHFLLISLEILTGLFIFAIGFSCLLIVILYVIDKSQTTQAIRHNYPVIGRFRYIFEHFGTFFRQYFFAMDREEMPFNRAERAWVYRAAKAVDNTAAFGSSYNINQPGAVIFVNCTFPTLDKDATQASEITLGSECRYPYKTRSFFNISAMSFGAISQPAVLALSSGAKMAGCWLNTGEGGLSPYHLAGGADLVFQIGTAKYGVRDEQGRLSEKKLAEIAAHPNVKMFELKLSQGAKPGKGGILPGAKVTREIATIRGIPVGEASISPNRHPEINSVSDLLDMIEQIRNITGKPCGFKTVIGNYRWLDELFDEIHKRGIQCAPDFITLDSADGGTGAAPQSLMDYMGLSIRESLPRVVDRLNASSLKQRIKLIASGKMINPAGVAWALCMGADVIVSARGFMFSLGCIQAMQCNKNTCPTGITTHDKKLQSGLNPELKSVRVANYAKSITHEVGIIAHSCGIKEPREFRRHHARRVTANGQSIGFDELYPEP